MTRNPLKLGTAVAALLFASSVFAGSAWAQDPAAQGPAGQGPGGFGDHRPPMERSFGHGERGRWWNNPTVATRLKLTDAQRKALDDTYQQHKETLVDLRGTLEKAEIELEPMMKEDQPNESQILAQIDKVAQARAELEKANARFLLDMRSKLTPEQRKQMEADRASRPHGDWQPGGPRGAWQPGGHRGQTPDGQSAPPPPNGPQSRLAPEAAFGPAFGDDGGLPPMGAEGELK